MNWAVGARNYESTSTLIELGANPNGDNSGSSIAPIILAVDHKDKPLYTLLLDKGADINTKDPNGYSLLHVAS